MRAFRMAVLVSLALFVCAPMAMAADFDWMRDLNVQASADPSGFRARVATRFQVGDAQISAVLSNVKEPANCYMVLRLGEMSHKPIDRVLAVYNSKKGKGWGVIAKSLGIKPGSAQFHALKKGHDLDGDFGKGKKYSRDKKQKNK